MFLRFGTPIQDIPYHKDRKAYIESRCKEYVDGVQENLLAVIPQEARLHRHTKDRRLASEIADPIAIIMDFVTSDVADETSSCVLM